MAECKPQPPPPKQLIEVPYEIQDPISHDVMWDPVLLVESGHSYDRPSIQQWFQRGNRTCPRTNRKLKSLLIATNWALRGLVHSWAQEHGVPVPPELLAAQPPTLPPAEEGTAAAGPSTSAGGVQSHPITLEEALRAAEAEPSSTPQHIPESWTFFQGYDSPGGDLFRLHCDHSGGAVAPMSQLLGAADKVPNCIAFNSSGHLKAALQPRSAWVLCDDAAAGPSSSGVAAAAVEVPAGQLMASGSGVALASAYSHFPHLHHEQVGLYVRSQCLPFIESGCSSWDAAATTPTDSSGWTFFPGMDSPGGDICQAVAPDAPAGPHAAAPSALSSVSGSITSTSAIALVALAKPFVVAFNSNGWLKTLLQPMHGWVKWTTEAGKGLFVRNDVVLALISGVLAHMQGTQASPVTLCGWTFFPGLDSLGGDVHWCWQAANNPAKLAEEASTIGGGVIAFNTNGYIKTALRPRSDWTKVELWADKPCSGLYIHNSVVWKLILT